MLRKLPTFKGGFKFKNYPGQAKPIFLTLDCPPGVIIPLNQSSDSQVKPIVKKGDTVFAGQLIGRDDAGTLCPAYSSVNGVVEDIKCVSYLKRNTIMVAIRATDSSSEIKRLDGYSSDWQKLSHKKIEELVFSSGAINLPESSFKKAKHIIIEEAQAEAYNSSLDLILEGKNTLNFLEGINILKKILPEVKVHLVINRDNNKLINEIIKLTNLDSRMDWFEVCPVESKYPQGCERVLLPVIAKKEIPYGACAADVGVMVLKAEEILAVYDAVVQGKPFIEKIVALCGPSFKENLHLKVRLGTPVSEIIKERLKVGDPARLILNSLLTGCELNDLSLPVDKGFSQIIAIAENRRRELLAFARPGIRRDSYGGVFLARWLPWFKKSVNTNQHGEERPCISCGFCEYACPARIIPHLLIRYVRKEIIDEALINYEIFNCVDCGLCTFACPSKIPLLKYIKEGQEKLLAEGFSAPPVEK